MNRLFSALAAAALAAGLASCAGTPATSVTSASTEVSLPSGHVAADVFLGAASLDGVTILDVRTPAEFLSGHLEGAVNIDVESPDFLQRIEELDLEGVYGLYCRSGNRSRVAEEAMRATGFTQVFGLDGGVTALDPSLLVTD